MKKIAENEKAIFYKNRFCEKKDGYKIIIAESKEDGIKEYLLLKDDKLVYANQQIEAIWNQRELMIMGII